MAGHASWLSVQLRKSSHLLEHAQIPELRALVQVRVPLAGAPEGTALPKQPATPCFMWGPKNLLCQHGPALRARCAKQPGSGTQVPRCLLRQWQTCEQGRLVLRRVPNTDAQRVFLLSGLAVTLSAWRLLGSATTVHKRSACSCCRT